MGTLNRAFPSAKETFFVKKKTKNFSEIDFSKKWFLLILVQILVGIDSERIQGHTHRESERRNFSKNILFISRFF